MIFGSAIKVLKQKKTVNVKFTLVLLESEGTFDKDELARVSLLGF